MRCVANYEIKSDMSAISDEARLTIRAPKGKFKARIANSSRADYTSPFLLSLQVEFEAAGLDQAKDAADEVLVECLNMLAFTTSARLSRHRIRQIVDATPESGMRDCLIWSDAIDHPDPVPFLDETVISSIERLLQAELPLGVQRALRWYRLGAEAEVLEEQFQYFWFALEILAQVNKGADKVPDRCAICKSSLYCETCRVHSTHRPYPKQAIRALIQAVEENCDDQLLERLDWARNALMHGEPGDEFEDADDDKEPHLVDVLGHVVFKALMHQFPREILKEGIRLGFHSTYIRRTMRGIAHVQTIVPRGADGELDLSFAGVKIQITTDGPPQSAEPSVLVMTAEQHARLGEFGRAGGQMNDVCRRVFQRVQAIPEGKVAALVSSTDMKSIRGFIQQGEAEPCRDLLREILAAGVHRP